MKMSLASKVLRFSLIMGIALLVAGSFLVTNYDTTKAQQQMVTLCHAAGQTGTLQFTTLTIAYNAAFGVAGHFNEDGTPNAGHENDYLGACIVIPTATSTAPVPTNTPTATATSTTQAPTNTPTSTLTTEPTNTPTATLTATTAVPTVEATTPVPTVASTQVSALGTPIGSSELLIPVTGVDLTGGSTAGKLLLSLGFGFLGLGLVSYGITKKQ